MKSVVYRFSPVICFKNSLLSLLRKAVKAASEVRQVEPYTALAEGYDEVMSHVDYDDWAHYAHRLIRRHHPEAEAVLELGCGTGSLALRLQPQGPYRYTATDGSPDMLRVARAKARSAGRPIRFREARFTDFEAEVPVDVVLLLYDGLNYLLEEEQVQALFERARSALRPGGLFLFDQSTPANSASNAEDFEGEGQTGYFAYERRSRYDARTRLHTTTLLLDTGSQRLREEHVQRAYTRSEIRRLVQRVSGLEEVAAYDGFTLAPAAEEAHRIHWVLQRSR